MSHPNRFSFIRPEKSLLYYGYIIAFFGTLGVWASLPGQTIGVGTFTEPVREALGLSLPQISVAYFVGTFISSLFIRKAGEWFDKYGARWLAVFAALGLALSLYLCSQADVISSKLASVLNIQHFLLPATVITILFFMLRFSGQGVLTLASRNMIMKWFDKLRGRVNAFSAITVSLGFSASPLWISKLIDAQGWKNAWLFMAGGVILTAILFFQFFRDNPEDHGLIPDGKFIKSKKNKASVSEKKQFTLKEAKNTRAFWMYSFSLSFFAFFYTGLTFLVESIFTSSGFTKELGVSIFVPISVVTVSVSLITNYISDWIKLQFLLYLNVLGGIIAATGLVFLSAPFGIYFLIVGCGITNGLFTVLIAVTWPRFFGRKHLGAISGKSMSMVVMASALGPALFSFSKTLFSTYAGIGILSIVFLIVIAFASRRAYNPQ